MKHKPWTPPEKWVTHRSHDRRTCNFVGSKMAALHRLRYSKWLHGLDAAVKRKVKLKKSVAPSQKQTIGVRSRSISLKCCSSNLRRDLASCRFRAACTLWRQDKFGVANCSHWTVPGDLFCFLGKYLTGLSAVAKM